MLTKSNYTMIDNNAVGISPTALVAPEGKDIIGTIVTKSDTYCQGQNSWSGSAASGNSFYNYNPASDQTTLIQMMNMIFGDGYGNGYTNSSSFYNYSASSFIGDDQYGYARTLEFANGTRVGYAKEAHHLTQNPLTGYAWRILPIRNISNNIIPVSVYGAASSYWYYGYEGCCLFALLPTTPGLYSNVKSTRTVSLSQATGSSILKNNLNGVIDIPAKTTILLILCSSEYAYSSGPARYHSVNYFQYLNRTFSDPNIVCDMRMLSSLARSRFNMYYNVGGANSNVLAPIWTKTAINYGDQ